MPRGRPKKPSRLVPESQLLNRSLMLQERWTSSTLSSILSEQDKCLVWLVQRRLLRNSCACTECGLECTRNRHSRSTDGYQWKCSACQIVISIRRGSFFENSNHPLNVLVLLIYSWSKETPQNEVSYELGVRSGCARLEYRGAARAQAPRSARYNGSGAAANHVNLAEKCIVHARLCTAGLMNAKGLAVVHEDAPLGTPFHILFMGAP